ncbi:hypothetical protein ACJ41O_000366 [Fusarium nematophilum]
MKLSSLLKGRIARSSTKQAAAAIASAPTSQVESSANSQAFSVAVAELIEGLDFVLDRIDEEAEQSDLLRYHLLRLAKEISKYENSTVRDEISEAWDCDLGVIQLLLSACRCACSVYDTKTQPGADLMPVISRTPSITGTVKATSIWKADAEKTLFVSIRGTASKMDHMVNFNKDSRDAAAMFSLPGSTADVSAHGGFLACAGTLLSWITQEVIRQVELDDELTDIVFTGHSAGGSVAAIVFLHFACHYKPELSNIKFSLITFGSPPVTSVDVTEQTRLLVNTKHVLAVVNEYDLVPRMDQAYLFSIISLYRSAYGLSTKGSGDDSSARQSLAEKTVHDKQWELPPPDHHVVGDVIVLRARLDLATPTLADGQDGVADKSPTQTLDMVQIPNSEFSRLLFFDISVHKRRIYLERLEKLACSRIIDGPGLS